MRSLPAHDVAHSTTAPVCEIQRLHPRMVDDELCRQAAIVQFTKHLRDPIKRGEITISIRIWQRPHVKVGNRYKLDDGFVVIEKISKIELSDITPELARDSGFTGVVDLLRTAKHGAGENVYLIRFRYEQECPP